MTALVALMLSIYLFIDRLDRGGQFAYIELTTAVLVMTESCILFNSMYHFNEQVRSSGNDWHIFVGL